jgi:hypothetical protein
MFGWFKKKHPKGKDGVCAGCNVGKHHPSQTREIAGDDGELHNCKCETCQAKSGIKFENE